MSVAHSLILARAAPVPRERSSVAVDGHPAIWATRPALLALLGLHGNGTTPAAEAEATVVVEAEAKMQAEVDDCGHRRREHSPAQNQSSRLPRHFTDVGL